MVNASTVIPALFLLCLPGRIVFEIVLSLPLAGGALVQETRSPSFLPETVGFERQNGIWGRECSGREEKGDKGEKAWNRV